MASQFLEPDHKANLKFVDMIPEQPVQKAENIVVVTAISISEDHNILTWL